VKMTVSRWLIWSGRRDLNPGPLAPQTELAGMSKMPNFNSLRFWQIDASC
jgi:hypothetical protein